MKILNNVNINKKQINIFMIQFFNLIEKNVI